MSTLEINKLRSDLALWLNSFKEGIVDLEDVLDQLPFVFEDNYKAQLDQAIKEAVEKAWISVDDRLPEPFELVIVCQIDAVFTARYQGNDEWESGNGLLIQAPEYWMPLPSPPKTGD